MLASILLVFIAVTPAMAQGDKIAVIDIDKLLNESKAGQSIAKQVQDKQATFQKEFSAKEKELLDAQKTLIDEKNNLSADEFAKKRKEFEEKLISTRKLFQKRRTDLDRALSEALGTLRRNVVEVTAAVAEKEGYDIVLTRDSVVIAEKTLDITTPVLADLNAKIDNIKLGL
jgi:Skp family chaperone for outer membrane proteins